MIESDSLVSRKPCSSYQKNSYYTVAIKLLEEPKLKGARAEWV